MTDAVPYLDGHCQSHGRPDQYHSLPALATFRTHHYILHDYLQWNHSADWWEQRSEDQAAKGSVGMHRRWHVRRSVFREDCKHCQADNKRYSKRNNKPVTEPEPEPEPESIPSTR
jgi:hypothetical protein